VNPFFTTVAKIYKCSFSGLHELLSELHNQTKPNANYLGFDVSRTIELSVQNLVETVELYGKSAPKLLPRCKLMLFLHTVNKADLHYGDY
jgi:hypothetical protein